MTLTHPEIIGADLPAGVAVASPTGETRRLDGGGAISDQPTELTGRGHTLVGADPLTGAWSAGYAHAEGAPYQRPMVLGYALARLSAVAGTSTYRLTDRGDGDADVDALDAQGSTLATWRITGGGGGIPSSVAKQ